MKNNIEILKEFIKLIFGKLGFIVSRKQPWMGNNLWLEKQNINTVLDVGANVGKFAFEISKIIPQAKIFAFEPIKDVFLDLKNNTKDLNIQLYNFALGDKNEKVSININEFSPSSSILSMTEVHRSNVKQAQKTTSETIEVRRLDDEFTLKDLKQPILAKIDVQGFEDKVLSGGFKVFSNCKIILIEISYKELYAEQKLFHDIYMQLHELGFNFMGVNENYFDRHDGSPIYSNAIFINRNLPNK